MTNIHALSGIRTHDLSVKTIKAYASDLAATGTVDFYPTVINVVEF
jgi:N-acetylglucosamine-6-phosphate deacetylase